MVKLYSIHDYDWVTSEPPKYIETPRRWLNGAFNKITDRYIGISCMPIEPFGLQVGETWWLPSDTMIRLISLKIDIIYERLEYDRYKYVPHEDRVSFSSNACFDCKGKGTYVGFWTIENCRKCNGKGHT